MLGMQYMVHRCDWRVLKHKGKGPLNSKSGIDPTSESGKATKNNNFPTFRGPFSGGMVG